MHQHAVCRHVPRGAEDEAARGLTEEAAAHGVAVTTFTADGLVVGVCDGAEPASVAGAEPMHVVIERTAGAGGSLHAIRYPIRDGMTDIAEQVFRGSGDPPLTAGTTRLLRTWVYRKDSLLVRVFAIDGDVDELVEGLARAVEVHDVGRRMGALFVGSYDFTDREGLRAFFRDNLMRAGQAVPA